MTDLLTVVNSANTMLSTKTDLLDPFAEPRAPGGRFARWLLAYDVFFTFIMPLVDVATDIASATSVFIGGNQCLTVDFGSNPDADSTIAGALILSLLGASSGLVTTIWFYVLIARRHWPKPSADLTGWDRLKTCVESVDRAAATNRFCLKEAAWNQLHAIHLFAFIFEDVPSLCAAAIYASVLPLQVIQIIGAAASLLVVSNTIGVFGSLIFQALGRLCCQARTFLRLRFACCIILGLITFCFLITVLGAFWTPRLESVAFNHVSFRSPDDSFRTSVGVTVAAVQLAAGDAALFQWQAATPDEAIAWITTSGSFWTAGVAFQLLNDSTIGTFSARSLNARPPTFENYYAVFESSDLEPRFAKLESFVLFHSVQEPRLLFNVPNCRTGVEAENGTALPDGFLELARSWRANSSSPLVMFPTCAFDATTPQVVNCTAILPMEIQHTPTLLEACRGCASATALCASVLGDLAAGATTVEWRRDFGPGIDSSECT